ncbi:hypothetical protein P8X30_02245 [Pyrococcus kukulkanii]|nr:hypothetical protein [Pyrococcus kukulkanii]
MVLSVGIIEIGIQESENTEAFSIASKIKVFAVSTRDLITKAYSIGPGYSIRVKFPISLSQGDYVNIILTGDAVVINANISDTLYSTAVKLPIRVSSHTSVLITENSPDFWIIAYYNETKGGVDVKLAKSPDGH